MPEDEANQNMLMMMMVTTTKTTMLRHTKYHYRTIGTDTHTHQQIHTVQQLNEKKKCCDYIEWPFWNNTLDVSELSSAHNMCCGFQFTIFMLNALLCVAHIIWSRRASLRGSDCASVFLFNTLCWSPIANRAIARARTCAATCCICIPNVCVHNVTHHTHSLYIQPRQVSVSLISRSLISPNSFDLPRSSERECGLREQLEIFEKITWDQLGLCNCN